MAKKDNSSAIIFGKNVRGTKLPDKKATKEFFKRFDPHKFLNTKAEKPKQILKKN